MVAQHGAGKVVQAVLVQVAPELLQAPDQGIRMGLKPEVAVVQFNARFLTPGLALRIPVEGNGCGSKGIGLIGNGQRPDTLVVHTLGPNRSGN